MFRPHYRHCSSGSLLLAIFLLLSGLHVRESAGQWTPSEITGSFYGDSHLWMALQDASSGTELSLSFRTRQRDAIIFLAAGETDYCLVELRNGRLRIRINLGSGEAVMQSPRGLKLDDYSWHSAHLSRRNAQATLTIDRQYVSHLIIPNNAFSQLNIIYGVYLGGLGNFRELFLGNHVPFRGCLKGVKLVLTEANRLRNFDVLRTAYLHNQSDSAMSTLQHVSWECDDEFNAKNQDPISIIQPDSYVMFPTLQIRQNGTIDFSVKTIATEGLVIYNGGSPTQPDFLSIDILKGRIRFQLEKGNGLLLLESRKEINDGHFHNVTCRVSVSHAELIVDGEKVTATPRSSVQRFLDLDGPMYLGGVEPTRKPRLRQQGLYDRSLLGCIKNIRINQQETGLENVLASNGIEPGCVWDYPCSREPCIESAKCSQVGLDSYRCDCDLDKCEKERMIDWSRVLKISNFTVKEGQQHVITQDDIRVIWNYQSESIRDAQITFQIAKQPIHGKIDIRLIPRIGNSTFTYLDVKSDRVVYQHDGSEERHDQFELAITVPTLDGNLTSTFLVAVTILPENDAPVLFLNGPLEIVPGTARVLTADVIRAFDPDSSADTLTFNLLTPLKVAYFRYANPIADFPSSSSGSRLTQFTQADLDAGIVEVFFNGTLNDQEQAVFSITDGIHNGKEKATLAIVPLKLILNAVTNRVVNVPVNSSSLLTQNSLSFSTNAIHQNLTVQYTLINQPTFGRVEILRGSRWLPAENFTQDDINMLAVRYVHLKENPSRDAFRVRIAALSESGVLIPTKDQTHTVQVRFLENRLKTVHLEPVVFHSPHVIISSMNLLHEQEPVPLSAEDIRYKMVRTPKFGIIQRSGKQLSEGDIFSQSDVNSGLIVYSLQSTANPDLPIRDSILMNVEATSLGTNPVNSKRLIIKYDPPRSTLKLRDSVFAVKEGASSPLTPDLIGLQQNGVDLACSFEVVQFAEHGALQSRDRKNVSSFTSDDLRERAVHYTHDSSEAENDELLVKASCGTARQTFQIPLMVNISLHNNHRPAAVRLGPIFTVQNSTRIVTSEDILVSDVDSEPSQGTLQIAHRTLQNGEFVHVSDMHTPVFQFSQKDIQEGHILLRHRGALQAESTVYISDGELFTTEKLTIQAEPFRLTVKEQLTVILNGSTSASFSFQQFEIQTNSDPRWNPVLASIHRTPKFGNAAVRNSSVSYVRREDAPESAVDSFIVLFTVNNFSATTNVTVFAARPMRVGKPRLLLVKENALAAIFDEVLNASHPVFEPSKLVYTIEKPPIFGSLSLGPAATSEQFTQEDINLGRVKYVHRKFSKTFRDQFKVRVEAPLAADAAAVSVKVLVVPEVLRLSNNQGIAVLEGEDVRIKISSLLTDIPNSEYLPIKVTLKDKPGHGKVATDEPGYLVYTHDGSEIPTDVFTVNVSLDRLGISSVQEISVSVSPVNDNHPQIIIKHPLECWIGKDGILGTDQIVVEDDDGDADLNGTVITVNGTRVDFSVDGQKTNRFTYGQVISRTVRFTPNAANVSRIFLRASDGKLDSPVVALDVKVMDLVLSLLRNETVEVNRNSSAVVTTDEIDVSLRKVSARNSGVSESMNHDPSQLVFTIIEPPKFGYIGLFKNADSIGELTRTSAFTQKDLQDGRVGYMQNIPVTDAAIDIVSLDAMIHEPVSKRINDIKFMVNIKTLSSTVQSRVLAVPFGRSVLVKRIHLDATQLLPRNDWKKIKFLLTTAPKLGSFLLDNVAMKSGSSFTQVDVNKQRVTYQHSGKDSQTATEIVAFKVQLPDSKGSTVQLNITILESDTILKVSAADTDVVRGENLTLSNAIIKTSFDSFPYKTVRYRLLKDLRGAGLFVRNGPTKEFTQRDVMDGVAVIAHDGSDEPRTIPVQLEVLPTDESTAVSELVQFNVHVIPFFFRLDHHANITLLQGDFIAPLNSTHISVASNADKSRILYKIVKQPTNGKLRHSDLPKEAFMKSFTQIDLDKGKISYEHAKMENCEDSFTVDIFLLKRDDSLSIRNVTIHVAVVPLAKIEPVLVPIGHSIAIGPNILDASGLKERFKKQPTFFITNGPQFGSLVDVTSNSAPVTNFTLADIFDKRILYRAPAEPVNSSVDRIDFVLKVAPNIQSAPGSLTIRLKSLPQQPIKIVTNDDLLIAMIIVGIVLAAVVVFIFLCLRTRRQTKMRKRSVSRHAHLSPLFNAKSRTGDSPDETVDLAPNPSVPNCKVIPLRKAGRNFHSAESELQHLDAYREDMYGMTGNGYVSKSESKPVLNSNQYWV